MLEGEIIVESGVERQGVLEGQLHTYLNTFYNRVRLTPESAFRNDEILETAFTNAASIIERNNFIADTISSPNYIRIVEAEKELQGRCELLFSWCIDGRIPWIHVAGLNASVWEAKAGIIPTFTNAQGQLELDSGSIKENIDAKARDGLPILEILIAHTHGEKTGDCGAMKERKQRGLVPEDQTNLLAENLRLHSQAGALMSDQYNRAARLSNQPELAQAAITAVYDTDAMGMIFGYKTPELRFSTTGLTIYLSGSLSEQLGEKLGDDYMHPGIRKQDFQNAAFAPQMEQMLLDMSKCLLEDEQFDLFRRMMRKHADVLFPDLTQEQHQALEFFIVRTVSRQYLTGLYQKTGERHHFSDHGEGSMSISPDGETVGQFDSDKQVFGASVTSSEEAVDHIKTKIALMEHHNGNSRVQKPFVLFVSSSVGISDSDHTLTRVRSRSRKLYGDIINEPEIAEKIQQGELVLIPALIDENTAEILDIPNFAI